MRDSAATDLDRIELDSADESSATDLARVEPVFPDDVSDDDELCLALDFDDSDPIITSDGLAYLRPETRADCEGQPRPCPFIGCRWHLFGTLSGVARFRSRRASLATMSDEQAVERIESMSHSCVLDICDEHPGGSTLFVIADALGGLTKERARQIQERALPKFRRRLALLSGEDDADLWRSSSPEGRVDPEGPPRW